MTDTLRDAIAALQADDAPTERECGYQDAIDEVLRILDARAALAAAPQPAPAYDPTTQPYDEPFRHVDQPAPDREALVQVIVQAMLGRVVGLHMAQSIADALLARGLRLTGAEDHRLDHIRALVKEADEKGLWRTETIQMPKRVVEGGDDEH